MLKEITGLSGTLFEGVKEGECSSMASDWLVSVYDEGWLINCVKRFLKYNKNDPERVYDLINDVYVSLVNSESTGDGYDISCEDMTVEKFVLGRLRLFAKNAAYSANSSQVASGINGTYFRVVAASFDRNNNDEMDEFQLAYNNAADYDDLISEVEDRVSLVAQIQYCEKFEVEHNLGINLKRLFQNMHILSNPNIDFHYFDRIREACAKYEDFADAFGSILKFCQSHRDSYEAIVATI